MPGLLDQIRFPALKLLYDGFLGIMVRDKSWQKSLFTSIAPKASSRILIFGPASISAAWTFARRFREANFIGVDPNPKAVEKARRSIARRNISNLMVIEAPVYGRLRFDARSFDKIVLVLTLHNRPPDEKLGIVKEMLRLLRRGGTLHVAEYDKPAAPGEDAVLKLARYISRPTAAEPHLDGSWTKFLAKAGFTCIRLQSSHSIRVGRISVVKARKR
jgi:ubiquinone/menaquinone biosynthesis C-methylase UbiE